PARSVLVSNPLIADVIIRTPQQLYVLGQQIGDTNVFILDDDGRQILQLEVRVELDLTGLRKAITSIMPGERVEVTAVNANIVLTGTVRSSQAAENARLLARRFVEDDDSIINMLRISADHQVMLRVRIAEMDRSVGKQLGFNTTIGLRTGIGGKDGKTTATVDGGFGLGPFNDPASFGSIGVDLFLGKFFDMLNATVDALESQGLVNTLVQPTLTAVSGENANLLVGGEFPVPIGITFTADVVTQDIEFKSFGILLTFTPVVLDSGLISLKLSTEVSQLNFGEGALTIANGGVIPALDVRRTETTVELPSGGGIVIGGLLQENISSMVDGFPGLKDIPILGTLFRSTQFQKGETELVIMVSAYLVKAVSGREFALPSDGFVASNDFDLYLLGRLHAVYAKTDLPPPIEQLQGTIGYIME
ncbi:MAG: type II and III secretion system protein family protein, partial [Alphaproteobacteria bacterium]|nr:type II and III secretion system protein family protein [Alphaproteobacteria bacterium]